MNRLPPLACSVCWLVQAAPSARAFYVKAVKQMWKQVTVLSTSALGQVVAAGILTLTHPGKRTPGILYAALVSSLCVEYIGRFLTRSTCANPR